MELKAVLPFQMKACVRSSVPENWVDTSLQCGDTFLGIATFPEAPTMFTWCKSACELLLFQVYTSLVYNLYYVWYYLLVNFSFLIPTVPSLRRIRTGIVHLRISARSCAQTPSCLAWICTVACDWPLPVSVLLALVISQSTVSITQLEFVMFLHWLW